MAKPTGETVNVTQTYHVILSSVPSVYIDLLMLLLHFHIFELSILFSPAEASEHADKLPKSAAIEGLSHRMLSNC